MPILAYKYAGILGTLALSVVVLRAVKESASCASALWTGTLLLAAFSAAGLVIGWFADATIVQSVRMQFEQQIQGEARKSPEEATPPIS